MSAERRRKPPARVVGIAGKHSRGLVTQAELRAICDLQEAEWIASRAAQKAILNLEDSLSHGVPEEPGELAFDRELRMVRSRKQKAGGE